MVTHIARLGKIIGQYSPEELQKALFEGAVTGADHWWRPGMKDWLLVSSVSPLPPMAKSPVGKTTRGEKDWRVRPAHRPTRFDEPATEKQLALIKQAGLTDILGLTRHDASRWLELILGTSDGRRSLNVRQYQAKQEQDALNEKAGLGCDGHRTPSGQYRKEIKYCLQSIEEKRLEVQQAVEDDPDDAASQLADLETERKDYQDAIDQQMEMRVDYWIWVIETARNADEYSGDHELFSEDFLWVEESLAERLSALARKIVSAPTRNQVKHALMKCDAASQSWDDDQPDLLLSHF